MSVEYIDEQTGTHMIVQGEKRTIFFTRVNDIDATKDAITRLEERARQGMPPGDQMIQQDQRQQDQAGMGEYGQ